MQLWSLSPFGFKQDNMMTFQNLLTMKRLLLMTERNLHVHVYQSKHLAAGTDF